MKLTKKDRQALDSFFLFKGLGEEKETVYEKLIVQSFTAGEVIYTKERFANALGIVLSGECTVYNHQTELNHIPQGKCFGAAAIFAKEAYVTTIQTKKASRIAFLTSGDLTELFRSYPEMAVRYIEFLSERILFLNHRIDSFTAPTSEEAVTEYLEKHKNADGIVEIEGGFARLSRELSIGRATLYRVMNKLEEKNKIVKNGSKIRIINLTNKRIEEF